MGLNKIMIIDIRFGLSRRSRLVMVYLFYDLLLFSSRKPLSFFTTLIFLYYRHINKQVRHVHQEGPEGCTHAGVVTAWYHCSYFDPLIYNIYFLFYFSFMCTVMHVLVVSTVRCKDSWNCCICIFLYVCFHLGYYLLAVMML